MTSFMYLRGVRFKTSILCIFCLFSKDVISQESKWLVRFADRPDTVVQIENDYHPKAIARRKSTGFSPSDYPVSELYISHVRASGADICHPLRWFNGVSCLASPDEISTIQALPFVDDVVPLGDMRSEISEIGEGSIHDWSMSNQRAVHDGELLEDKGLTGKGMRIAVLDVGFKGIEATKELNHLFEKNLIEKTWDFIRNKEQLGGRSSHGTSVLACLAGVSANNPLGFARDATYLLAVTERSGADVSNEEDHWLAAIEWADRNGVDVVNSSLGYTYHRYFQADMNGHTSLVSEAALIAARKGILVVVAAGNEGNKNWEVISTPADTDSILSIGGIDKNMHQRISFSSFGPTADGRLKPELVAFGEVSTANGDGLVEMHGTSFASPLLAGFAAAIWQAFPDDNNMQIRQRLMESGHLFPFFNYSLGYGIPKACNIFEPYEVGPTFDCLSGEEGYVIMIRPEYIDQKGKEYDRVYFHLVDGNNKILHYRTTVPAFEKGGVVEHDLFEIHELAEICRIHYKGYTYEIDFTKPR